MFLRFDRWHYATRNQLQLACILAHVMCGSGVWFILTTMQYLPCLKVRVPPDLYMEILTPISDGVKRWGLWEVLRSSEWSPHEWG